MTDWRGDTTYAVRHFREAGNPRHGGSGVCHSSYVGKQKTAVRLGGHTHAVEPQYAAGDASPTSALSSQNPNCENIESSVIVSLCLPEAATSVAGDPLAFALISMP